MKTEINVYERVAAHISNCLNRNENPSSKINQIEGVKIIEEYAKQESTAFSEWTNINGYQFFKDHNIWTKPLQINKCWTTNELYKLYKDENTQRSKG